VKYGSARKCHQKFWHKFHFERVPSRQTVHNLVNLRTTGLLIEECRVLTEEKSNDTGARFEYTPRKSLKLLAQETGVSKCSSGTATQLLKLRPHKTTVIHARLGSARSSKQGSFLCFYSLLSKVRSIRN
jgi:hypothetical protein